MITKNYLKNRNEFMDTLNPFNLGTLSAELFAGKEGIFLPRVDVLETQDAYKVNVALPGFKKDDIQVKIEEQILTISGERKQVKEENTTYHRVETRFGMFERSFKLGNKADAEKVDAKFEDGILNITISKKEKEVAKSSVVEIK